MVEIAPGVTSGVLAREWRCKWSEDLDRKSLEDAHKLLVLMLPKIKEVDGVKEVERIICASCYDFKVVTSMSAFKFSDWEHAKFAPEAEFLAALAEIDGISQIETQTYTLMKM
mmetsp:Transcript_22181/g.51827  ORF Transcript_22181/g.51827 Transcript_22181/m.51827 type:complete len:113 (-) Transcript_22181:133-471(-)|eukprot:CAMPEP_0171092442 /NCGR_PEP_ID=MMETSP0766_2-20121228/35690_1 /TAXON_ID=439317 /ORGANISM="Gambierdiscus australes, Strain CAWD 149" /LENGTH=112 /DNA_ID=CAMNT_0011550673 /DNA_START=69 /DNA_END=407 /DNA_ORIENTATION=+